MHEFFASYWWLMFPLGAFLFGAWDRWLAYKRSQDHLDLIKTFAAQGKELPPELTQRFRAETEDDVPPPGYPGYGYGGYWGHPRYWRRAMRGYYRWGPYWQWRKVMVTGAIAAGLWWASAYADWPGAHAGLRVAAVILTVISFCNLVAAILSSSFRGK